MLLSLFMPLHRVLFSTSAEKYQFGAGNINRAAVRDWEWETKIRRGLMLHLM